MYIFVAKHYKLFNKKALEPKPVVLRCRAASHGNPSETALDAAGTLAPSARAHVTLP